MTKPRKHAARVIDVDDKKNSVVIIVGDRQHQISWAGTLPVVGDVYAATFSPEPEILEKLCGGNPAISLNDGDVMRWRKPDVHGRSRMETLQKRHLIKRAVRDYLHEEGFVEIDMPLLVRGATPDAEIESFRVEDHYLTTSTEYQIRRMEIGGFERLYSLTQNFRKGETGRYRNPEFTMLEWDRVGAPLADIENDLEQIIRRAHQTLGGGDTLVYQEKNINIKPPFDRMTVKEATQKITGAALEDFSAASFRKAIDAAKLNLHGVAADDAPHLFSMLMDYLQTYLGHEKPVFIHEWPAFQTSSAKEGKSGEFVERSELYIAGIELSNGFPALTEPKRQRETFEAQNNRRKAQGKQTVDIDEAYLNATSEGFPSGAGMALGFERLVMVLTDQPSLAQVLAYNWYEL